jgi:hypothetical protein
MDKMDPVEPIDRMDPLEPMLRIDPPEPAGRRDLAAFRMRPLSQQALAGSGPANARG